MEPIKILFCNELCLLLFFTAITEAKRTLTVLLSLYEIKATYMSLKALHGEDGKHCFGFFFSYGYCCIYFFPYLNAASQYIGV